MLTVCKGEGIKNGRTETEVIVIYNDFYKNYDTKINAYIYIYRYTQRDIYIQIHKYKDTHRYTDTQAITEAWYHLANTELSGHLV